MAGKIIEFVGIAAMACFVVGLAVSIGAVPFYLIAFATLGMMLYEWGRGWIGKRNGLRRGKGDDSESRRSP